MKKTAYLAIAYLCNENCKFCPCSKNEKKLEETTSYSEIIQSITEFQAKGIERVVISGGEPTLHPDLVRIINSIQSVGMYVVLLSNSERFANTKFFESFINGIDSSKIEVITTLHSHIEKKHEEANQTHGSFHRTVEGLHNLCKSKITVIIKHCITKHNYKELSDFYVFCDTNFPEEVSIQLCGIDYCGIPKEKLKDEMLSFVDLRPHLEYMFDLHISRQNEGNCRNLYTINIPLCAADVFYWNYKCFMRKKTGKIYQAYKDPRNHSVSDVDNNVSQCIGACEECKANTVCSGTYKSAFEAFGDAIIKPYV